MISLSDIFFTFLKINALTFGGGYTIVPVIRDEFILKRKLIEENEMLDMISLAQSGPGAMAISTSFLTGYRLRGIKGGLTAIAASILPCLVIISILFYFYETFKTNFYVQSALEGMAGVISAVLFISVFGMAKSAVRKHMIFSIIVMISAFVASYFLNISAGYIILTCALLGLGLFSLVEEDKVK